MFPVTLKRWNPWSIDANSAPPLKPGLVPASRRKRDVTRTFLASVIVLASVSAVPAASARTCPDWLDARTLTAKTAPYSCTCAAGLNRHSAYGVYRYHPDSHICTAARHDGRIGLRGGPVTVYFGPGCSYYREAGRNSIQSRRKGASRVSFAFAHPLPPCSPPPQPQPKRREQEEKRDATEPGD